MTGGISENGEATNETFSSDLISKIDQVKRKRRKWSERTRLVSLIVFYLFERISMGQSNPTFLIEGNGKTDHSDFPQKF